VLYLLLLVSSPVDSQSQLASAISGTFRYGHVFWNRISGNTVQFTVEASYTRIVDTSYFRGSGADGYAQIGDMVVMVGRETPTFEFGDGFLADRLTMKVMAYSIESNWILGQAVFEHTYATPNNAGSPWVFKFAGCCRIANLLQAANQPWLLLGEVDLLQSVSSPRSFIPPVIGGKYCQNAQYGEFASILIPASMTDPYGRSVATPYLRVDEPFQTNTMTQFGDQNTHGIAMLPLNNQITTSQQQCVPDHNNGLGCFGYLLQSNVNVPASTIEGVVKIDSPEGGVVLSTGPGPGSGSGSATCLLDKCKISMIYVKVNESHVTVGHELQVGSDQFVLSVVGFALPEKLAVGRCMHVAVVRHSFADGGKDYSTYKVYANGQLLNKGDFPPCQAGVACTGGRRGGTSVKALSEGESNPIQGPRSSLSTDPLGSDTYLLFGGYRGAAGSPSFFQGSIREWRFWLGERNAGEILRWYQRQIEPSLTNSYGDPTSLYGQRMTSPADYQIASQLLVLYSFDWSKAAAADSSCPPYRTNCQYSQVRATYPLGAAASSFTLEVDQGNPKVSHASQKCALAPSDSSVSPYTLSFQLLPGYNQLTVYLSWDANSTGVPVDIISRTIEAASCSGVSQFKVGSSTINEPSLELSGFISSPGSAATSTSIPPIIAKLSTVNVTAGMYLELTVKSEVSSSSALPPLQLFLDSGRSPSSMRFYTATTTTTTTSQSMSMRVTWTPCQQDLGINFVCFQSHARVLNGSLCSNQIDRPCSSNAECANNGVCVANYTTVAISPLKCVGINVMMEDAPVFNSSIPAQVELIMGRETAVDIGMSVQQCQSQLSLDVAPGSMLPPGASLSSLLVASWGCTARYKTLRWTPSPKVGGYSSRTCFVAKGLLSSSACAGLLPSSSERCIQLTVLPCVYSVRRDQQLQEIAGLFNMDWILLWSLNAEMLHPDYLVYREQNISVGHLYRSELTDMALDVVAARFGMTLSQVVEMNYNLAGAAVLPKGQRMCVVPNSCKGMSQTIYS